MPPLLWQNMGISLPLTRHRSLKASKPHELPRVHMCTSHISLLCLHMSHITAALYKSAHSLPRLALKVLDLLHQACQGVHVQRANSLSGRQYGQENRCLGTIWQFGVTSRVVAVLQDISNTGVTLSSLARLELRSVRNPQACCNLDKNVDAQQLLTINSLTGILTASAD